MQRKQEFSVPKLRALSSLPDISFNFTELKFYFQYFFRVALFNCNRDQKVRAEIDRVLPNGGKPSMKNIEALELVRLCIAESLRMYPEPPLLIR